MTGSEAMTALELRSVGVHPPPVFVDSLYSNTSQRSRSLVVTRVEVAVSPEFSTNRR